MPRSLKTLMWVVALALVCGNARAGETVSGDNDRRGLALTVYANGQALVNDRRSLSLDKGVNTISFEDVSPRMIKDSVHLDGGEGVGVLRKSYKFDLLTPEALLRKSVGREIGIVRVHPTTGEESMEKATVLSVAGGVVLKFDNRLETNVPGRLVFHDLPEGLRSRPALEMQVDSSGTQTRQITLRYLTNGLTWNAEYTALLNASEDRLDLEGWASMTNTSGIDFPNASFRLVAGDVNTVPVARGAAKSFSMVQAAPERAGPKRENLSGFHMYTIPQPLTLKDKESTQVLLLSASNVRIAREYVTRGQDNYFRPDRGEGSKTNPQIVIRLTNDKASGLALPLASGNVRFYTKDASGDVQYVGADRLPSVAVGGKTELSLGRAFDLTVARRQTDFKKLGPPRNAFEASYALELVNGGDKPTEIKVVEPIPGDWEILEESQKHQRLGMTAVWRIKAPAKGSSTLAYRVRYKH